MTLTQALKNTILYRNFRLDMFASRVMGKDIVNLNQLSDSQLEDLWEAIADNRETDDALLAMLRKVGEK
jgi:hypothetical protein